MNLQSVIANLEPESAQELLTTSPGVFNLRSVEPMMGFGGEAGGVCESLTLCTKLEEWLVYIS